MADTTPPSRSADADRASYETRDLRNVAPVYRTVPTEKAESDAAIFRRLLPIVKDVLGDVGPNPQHPVPHDGLGSPQTAVVAGDAAPLNPTGRYAGAEFAMNGEVVRVPVGDTIFQPADDTADIADATTGAVDRPLVDDSGIPAGDPEFEGDSPATDEELRG
jgi:hypothetical protein